MTARRSLAGLLAVCLLLAGCRKETPEPEPTQEPPAAAAPAADEPPAGEDHPIALDRLTVEIVVAWEDTDRMLENLDNLSRLLEAALASFDCTVEEPVTITLGTAGGITAQALGDGGVDAAFLPLEDLAEMEDGKAVQVLESAEQGFALAITGLRADQRFCGILAQALTETEEGREFVETCYPGAAFTSTYENGAGS